MGIRVVHGGAATIALGREAGIAQGEAAAAKIHAQQDLELRTALFDSLGHITDGINRRMKLLHDEQSKAEDHQFQADQQERRLASQERTAGVRADASITGKAISADAANYRASIGESGRSSRAAAREGGLMDRQKFSLESKAQNDAANREQKAPLIEAQTLATKAKGLWNQIQTKLGQEKLDALAKTKDGLDSMYTDPDTGEVKKDPTYLLALHELGSSGRISEATKQQLPWYAKKAGKPYVPASVDERTATAIAAADPHWASQAVRLQRSVADPADPTGKAKIPQPTKDAQNMMAALSVVHNLPEFSQASGDPEYYNKLVRTRDKYAQEAAMASDAGPPDPNDPIVVAHQNLDMKVQEEKAKRQRTLLPDTDREVKRMLANVPPEKKGMAAAMAWEKLAKERGITPEEFDEWTSQLPAASQMFAPSAPAEGPPK